MVHGGMMCRDVVCSGDDISVAVIATPNIQNIQNYIVVYFCALSRVFARIEMTKIRLTLFQITLTPWIQYISKATTVVCRHYNQ